MRVKLSQLVSWLLQAGLERKDFSMEINMTSILGPGGIGLGEGR